MFQLSTKGQRWLKVVHLTTVACWVGGAASLFLLHFLRFTKSGAQGLHGIDMAAHTIDMGIVVIAGALASLATGLVYSLLTGWGFLRHRWVMVKWLVTCAAIAFGTVCLGPWEEAMLAISAQQNASAASDGAYSLYRWLNFGFGALQLCVLIFLVWVSVFKPWRTAKKETDMV